MTRMPSQPEQNGVSPKEIPALSDAKKPSLMQKSRDFLQGTVGGKDLPRLVDDFTQEMVVVAEGLTEDQARLKESLALQAEQQDELSQRLRELEKQTRQIQKRLEEMNQQEQRRKKTQRGVSAILRQATWLAGIIASAWIITSLLRLFSK